MSNKLTAAQIDDLLERLKDPVQARAFLQEAGLIDEAGDHTPPYRAEPKPDLLRIGDVWDMVVDDPKSRKKNACIKKRFKIESWCEAELACRCVAEDGHVIFASKYDPSNDYYEPGVLKRISWGGQLWPFEAPGLVQ